MIEDGTTLRGQRLETLRSEIRFQSVLEIFHTLPPTITIFLFVRLLRPQCLNNMRARGIAELTLEANKIGEQIPKSVSTTFDA